MKTGAPCGPTFKYSCWNTKLQVRWYIQ